MTKKTTKLKQLDKPSINYGKILYMVFAMTILMSVLAVNCFAAGSTDMWTKATEIMKDVYGKVVGISTIAAVVTAAVALLLMNFSKNGKTVDESRAWLKRIIISWAILNGLGFIMAYVTPLFAGGQYTA
ncbi:MAG: fimbrial protein [Anaerofustis stercorihominis]|nr:fimbrial protein [Anaerofustis stercorihominis]